MTVSTASVKYDQHKWGTLRERERERETETDRETERQTDRQTEKLDETESQNK